MSEGKKKVFKPLMIDNIYDFFLKRRDNILPLVKDNNIDSENKINSVYIPKLYVKQCNVNNITSAKFNGTYRRCKIFL